MTNANETKIAKATALTPEEVAVIKSTVAKGTTDLELSYFLMTAKQMNLNPFMKEVWCYKDGKGNLLVFAGRDGFLKIAQQDKHWNGITSSEVRAKDKFEMNIPEGKITHTFSIQDRGEIIGAYAIVKPKGCDIATVEWVDFATYNKGYNVWKSHPADMIKKVAEIRVLKKAFGISGLASEHEFEISNGRAYAIDTDSHPTASDVAYVEKLIRSSTYDHEAQDLMLAKLTDLTWNEFETMVADLKMNQQNPLTDMGAGSQTDIKNNLLF